MAEQEAPKIEFPCRYPIKVVGRATPDYAAAIRSIIVCHTVRLSAPDLATNSSRSGTFDSISFSIVATGEDQLNAPPKALMASGRVSMVI